MKLNMQTDSSLFHQSLAQMAPVNQMSSIRSSLSLDFERVKCVRESYQL